MILTTRARYTRVYLRAERAHKLIIDRRRSAMDHRPRSPGFVITAAPVRSGPDRSYIGRNLQSLIRKSISLVVYAPSSPPILSANIHFSEFNQVAIKTNILTKAFHQRRRRSIPSSFFRRWASLQYFIHPLIGLWHLLSDTKQYRTLLNLPIRCLYRGGSDIAYVYKVTAKSGLVASQYNMISNACRHCSALWVVIHGEKNVVLESTAHLAILQTPCTLTK